MKHINRETKTKIESLPASSPESKWAPFHISGEASGCQNASRMIRNMVHGEVDEAYAEFFVPKIKHPWLIGAKGQTIRRISADTNVRIYVPADSKISVPTSATSNTLCQLEGELDNIFKAYDAMQAILSSPKGMAHSIKPVNTGSDSDAVDPSASGELSLTSTAADSRSHNTGSAVTTAGVVSSSSSAVADTPKALAVLAPSVVNGLTSCGSVTKADGIEAGIDAGEEEEVEVEESKPKSEKKILQDYTEYTVTKNIGIPSNIVGLLLVSNSNSKRSTDAHGYKGVSVMNHLQRFTNTRISRLLPAAATTVPTVCTVLNTADIASGVSEASTTEQQEKQEQKSDDAESAANTLGDAALADTSEFEGKTETETPAIVSTAAVGVVLVPFVVSGKSSKSVEKAIALLERIVNGERMTEVVRLASAEIIPRGKRGASTQWGASGGTSAPYVFSRSGKGVGIRTNSWKNRDRAGDTSTRDKTKSESN